MKPELDDDLSEYRKPRRRMFRCADGMCGADDCPNCHPEGPTQDEPDPLDAALPCACGGHALFHRAQGSADMPHIYCSNNPRCGRVVPAVFRTIAEAVAIWNGEDL